MASNSTTASVFAAQWKNPTGFLSLLVIIGGPVIQTALAQVTGPPFVSICFSFGWVSYAFSMIPALVGDGRLMPSADYVCKVINLETGYARTNKSWVLGRLLRDIEATKPLSNEALRVVVYRAVKRANGDILDPGWTSWCGLIAISLQLGIAVIPLALYTDWGIIMITALGTGICFATAALPQWRVEKLTCRLKSEKNIAITVGNGSRHVLVILGQGDGLDIEDMAAGEGPRHARPWFRSGWFVRFVNEDKNSIIVSRKNVLRDHRRAKSDSSLSIEEAMDAYIYDNGLTPRVKMWGGIPLPFWATRLFWMIFILFWSVLLLSVVALQANAWYLVAIGTIGMIQNALVAATGRAPETRGFRLVPKLDLIGEKVMDVLMDLDELEPGCGRTLLKEFFPGGLDVPKDRGEQDWWDEKKKRDVEANNNDEVPIKEVGEKDKNRYNETRYTEQNHSKRYSAEGVIEPTKPTRGKKNGITPAAVNQGNKAGQGRVNDSV
ncbi:MAG: hypothetical protein M1834_004891 [Cirrosporium novae-zelandiae]|nr:MAG: hypothetical protein M1834_004891 [Cirrosporium novae-zelandiae]